MADEDETGGGEPADLECQAVHVHRDVVELDGALDSGQRDRDQALLPGMAHQQDVGADAVTEQARGQRIGIADAHLFRARDKAHFFEKLGGMQVGVRVSDEDIGRNFVAVDHQPGTPAAHGLQRGFAGADHHVAGQHHVGLLGVDARLVQQLGARGEAHEGQHGAALLGEAHEVEYRRAVPIQVCRHADEGADGIKVGQGPGSICTTRIMAGIGCPQVTAIYNCAISAEEYGIPVCADGGLIYSGDIPIAIGAGAHSVMLGMMLAGTKESPGEFVFKEGRQWKSYRGMGSIGAILSNQNPQGRYGQKNTEGTLVPEGIEGLIPYRGELSNVIFQYIGGLRRGMGYVGAASIDELRTKADFYRLSSAGKAESHPHDIKITKEAIKIWKLQPI